MVQYSVLIADGDPDIIQYLSGTFIANGYNTVGTSSGANAFELYKKDTFDLVVADLALSEMDGMQLLEELRQYDPASKVILTTSASDKDMVTRAFRLGALDILEKPLEPEILISKIGELLAREDRALAGNLRTMSLASIVQINCEERNQAQLTLNHLGQSGSIYFKNGEMIHAETAGIAGEEAVYALLGWENGSFHLKMGAEPRQRTINMPWSGLLLEGMRRIDESTAGWIPDEDDDLDDDIAVVEPSNQLQERIVKALRNTREVESALICELDGTLITQDNSGDPGGETDLVGVIHDKVKFIGDLIDGGEFARAVLSGADNRFYIQKHDDHLIFMKLSKRSSAETVFESVQNIFKRYPAT